MSNVLRRLFHRQPVPEKERSCGDQVLVPVPHAPNHGEPGDISLPALGGGPIRAANDSTPIEPVRESRQLEPVDDPKPEKPPSDEETVERQIAALLSEWDKTSLCARREFLNRIDQRIITTHRIRSVHADSAGAVAG
jgi:hypothetical protein